LGVGSACRLQGSVDEVSLARRDASRERERTFDLLESGLDRVGPERAADLLEGEEAL